MLIHGVERVVHPDQRLLFEGLRRPRDVIERWGAKIPPANRRSAVIELVLPEGRFFLKVYAYAGLWRLRTLFIVSRAGREFRNLTRMAELGFNVPQPVAYGQERTAGFVSESFLMTRAIENAVDLRSLIDKPGSAPFPLPSTGERRRLIEDFARTLRHAHEKKFFIHTLRSKNLLLTRSALHVIDVPFAGIWRWRIFSGAGRVRDLAVLMHWARQLLSRTERMRFARAYGADRALLRKAQACQERHYP
jgi:tRNA A-37 threonylcarbamoyl transferase component Bud32